MLGQLFELSDIPRLLALIVIEVLLSADNALILAAMIQPLPKELRGKALLIGSASAIVLRGLAISAASIILRSFWIKLAGAIYLIYLCIHHFVKKNSPQKKRTFDSLWKTIVLIELMDLSFAMDSVIAGIAFISTPETAGLPINPKLWIVYVGAFTGLLMIRYAARAFIHLIDKYPGLSNSAYLLVGWVGIKLTLNIFLPNLILFPILFWVVFAAIVTIGFLPQKVEK
jgi:YkoY family integral membrane protein